jgi:hypothetical protein
MQRMLLTYSSAGTAKHSTQSTDIRFEDGVSRQQPCCKRTDIGTIPTHLGAIFSLPLNAIGEALLTCNHTCYATFDGGIVLTHGFLFLCRLTMQ